MPDAYTVSLPSWAPGCQGVLLSTSLPKRARALLPLLTREKNLGDEACGAEQALGR